MFIGRALAVLQAVQCSWSTLTCKRGGHDGTLHVRDGDDHGQFESEMSNNDLVSHTRNALNSLQSWYNAETGTWDTTGWWNSANCLTVLADHCDATRNVDEASLNLFNNTLYQAPKTNLGQTKIIHGGRIHTISIRDLPPPTSFLNGFYDDEGWWALAWIKVYDITKECQYLETAAAIFEDMKAGGSPCGGIWWDKKHTAQVAIANELFLSVAASLANRADDVKDLGKDKSYYLSTALQQWHWFLSSGMINRDALINDGLDENCQNNKQAIWSYNQGVILGGLVELHRAAPSEQYLNFARSIAHAAIEHLGDPRGILTDPCEHNDSCNTDGAQFKGIFMRNLASLYEATKDGVLKNFIQRNAQSIVAKDTDEQYHMALHWGGPFVAPANASTQSSAMDALVAATAVS